MQEAIQSPGFQSGIAMNLSKVSFSSPSCPQTYDCNNSAGDVSFDIGREPSYVAIISSGVSCLGSFLVIATFLLLKDMRTVAQKIITLLAIADLISAVGYILGSINFLVHLNVQSCKVFDALCTTQASITSWSSLCSFCWTLILAFYFYMVIVYNRKAFASRLVPLYNIIAWFCPLLVIVPLTVKQKLGYARYAAANWCFVEDPIRHGSRSGLLNNGTNNGETIAFIFVAGKLWEILTYIGVILIYTHIAGHLSRRHRRYQLPPGTAAEQAEKRLLYIPVLFLLLRVWGTTQFIYSIGVSSEIKKDPGCIPKGIHTGFVILGVLQAIGDPGQGWGNAILYVFMSPVVRNRLIINPLRKLIRKTGKALLAVGGDSSVEDQEEESSVREGNQNQGGNSVLDTPRLGRRRARSRLSENTLTSEVLDECEPTPCASPGPPPLGFHQSISQPPIEEVTETTTDTAVSTSLPT